MRGSTALLLAGAVAIVVATTAPVLAADDPVRVAPASEEVVPADGAADEPAAPPSVAADQSAADPRPAPGAVEADEVAAEEKAEPRRGDTGRREGDEPKQPLADASVTMRDIQFHPKTIEISPGDRVTWTNRDTAQHNAVDRGSFETRLLDQGESDSVTIDSAGTYNYICTVHPDMKGKLIAGAGSGGGSGTSNSSGTGGATSSSGGNTSALGGGGSGSSSSSESSGSLPNTGQEQLPLLILGAALIAAGLLTRAFHEYWIWR